MIDVRNDYEIRVGKFKGAVDPCTTAFRDFPSWVEDRFKLLDSGDKLESSGSAGASDKLTKEKGNKKVPRVAMYCTGGIRCEKASSFLLSKGFDEVKIRSKWFIRRVFKETAKFLMSYAW